MVADEKTVCPPSCESCLGNPCNCGRGAPVPELDAAQAAWAEGVRRRRSESKCRCGVSKAACAEAIAAVGVACCRRCRCAEELADERTSLAVLGLAGAGDDLAAARVFCVALGLVTVADVRRSVGGSYLCKKALRRALANYDSARQATRRRTHAPAGGPRP